jgi:hypothetical protein
MNNLNNLNNPLTHCANAIDPAIVAVSPDDDISKKTAAHGSAVSKSPHISIHTSLHVKLVHVLLFSNPLNIIDLHHLRRKHAATRKGKRTQQLQLLSSKETKGKLVSLFDFA